MHLFLQTQKIRSNILLAEGKKIPKNALEMTKRLERRNSLFEWGFVHLLTVVTLQLIINHC